uniref:Stress-response A/B barrel domain-containing protein n=1 Tax=Acrobeloides nanus TaxID=290746 RepID=A0A914C2U2_9BILA
MTETSVQNTPINEAAETARTYNPGTIRHIVMFKYKDDITAAQKQNVITAFLTLKDNCKRNGTAYIRDIEYGFPSSKEGKDQNMEVAFFAIKTTNSKTKKKISIMSMKSWTAAKM